MIFTINDHGVITHIINLNKILDTDNHDIRKDQEIIVFVPGAAKKNNVGKIVDNVSNVIQVQKEDIEKMAESASSKVSGFMKEIIELKSDDHDKKSKGLLIWIDIEKKIIQRHGRRIKPPTIKNPFFSDISRKTTLIFAFL